MRNKAILRNKKKKDCDHQSLYSFLIKSYDLFNELVGINMKTKNEQQIHIILKLFVTSQESFPISAFLSK